LALLTPNPELEKEWDELKELGDRYRELEKHITEKMKTWDILKRED
jgi:flagellar motility protein MotE (MotC chaperone)